MEKVYLTPEESLHALANGKILENEDGAEVLLEGSVILLRYTMGKHNTIVTQNYNAGFDKLCVPLESEETEAGNAP